MASLLNIKLTILTKNSKEKISTTYYKINEMLYNYKIIFNYMQAKTKLLFFMKTTLFPKQIDKK